MPEGMRADTGAALETLGVYLHALNLSHLRLADRVAVLGVGPIGLLIVRLARLAGAADIFVCDPNPKRLAAALPRATSESNARWSVVEDWPRPPAQTGAVC